jgi:cytochrome c biogenesis protein ResB
MFFLNLVFCSIQGWRAHFRPKPAAFKAASTVEWSLGKGGAEKLLDAMKGRGYRVKEVESGQGSRSFVAQRGLPSRPVSVIYHFGLALTFVGFLLSALTAFDGEVTLYPGETKKIPTTSPDMTINRWGKKLGMYRGNVDSVSLHLDSFKTEYTRYNMKYNVKDWKSSVVLRTKSGAEKKKVIEVNAPLRYGALTVYQMSYEQKFDVELSDTTINVVAGNPFKIPGFDGNFSVRIVYAGVLIKEGSEEPIVPNADLYYKEPGAKKSARVGELTLGARHLYNGTPMIMRNFAEATGLSFRRDNGVAFLYVAFILFILGLFLRIFWPSYRVSAFLDEREGKVYLSGKVAGVAAYEDSELAAIEKRFQEATR